MRKFLAKNVCWRAIVVGGVGSDEAMGGLKVYEFYRKAEVVVLKVNYKIDTGMINCG
jgi:hypothetical protein